MRKIIKLFLGISIMLLMTAGPYAAIVSLPTDHGQSAYQNLSDLLSDPLPSLPSHKESTQKASRSDAITIAVVDSLTVDWLPVMYEHLNESWEDYGSIPIVIDFESLDKEGITYEDIVETNADILLFHATNPSHFEYQFTIQEMEAIRRYVAEGHRIVVVWKYFGASTPNNYLLDMVGLNVTRIQMSLTDPLYECVEADLPVHVVQQHPIFNNLPLDFTLVHSETITPERFKSWDERYLTTGTYLGFITQDYWTFGSIVLNLDNSVFISAGLDIVADSNGMQLLYNAFTFPYYNRFIITAQAPRNVLVNTPVQFYGYVTGGEPDYTWSWDFGDGTTSTERNPLHLYSAVSEYTVTLTGTDQAGNVSTDTLVVTTKEVLADAYIHHSGATNFPAPPVSGHSVQGVGGMPPYTYQWDFGDGGLSIEQHPIHLYNSAGDFTIAVTVTDNQSHSDTVQQGIHVVVGPLYLESIESNLGEAHQAVTYQPVHFVASVSGGIRPYSYDWDFGDGTTHSSDITPVHCYTQAGAYRIILTITDAEGSVLEGTVNDFPIWITNYTALTLNSWDRTAVVGKRCEFSFSKDGGVPPYSYIINWGDLTYETGILANQSGSMWFSLYHTYAWEGTFNFTLTLTDNLGTSVSVTKTATVRPMLHVTHDGPYTGTTGETISFTCSVDGGIPRYNYCIDVDGDLSHWDFRIYRSYQTSVTVQYVYSTAGRYDVRFYVYDEVGCQAYANTSIVIGLPGELVVNVGGPYEGRVGQPVTFRGSFTGAISPDPLIQWEFGDDSHASGLETYHSYATEGVFPVQLTLIDSSTGGAPKSIVSDETTATILPIEPLEVTIPGPYNGVCDVPVPFSCFVRGGYEPYDFAWEFGDGTSREGLRQQHVYTSPGIYHMNFTVIDTYGFMKTNHTTVTIRERSPVVWVDDDFTENTTGFGYDHFQYIADAAYNVLENGSIYVLNGTYHENVLVDRSVKIFGVYPEHTIIDGNGGESCFSLYSVDHVLIKGVTCSNSRLGFFVFYSRNCTFSDNIVNCTNGGIFLYSSSHILISHNVFHHAEYGCYLESSTDNILEKNTLCHNRYGIMFYDASYNIVKGNDLLQNSRYGVYMYNEPGITSRYNILYHNNFLRNYQQVCAVGGNQWDAGYPDGGNYWSGYGGSDRYHGEQQNLLGSDGIGDEPSLIYNSEQQIVGQDQYPFMNKNGWDFLTTSAVVPP